MSERKCNRCGEKFPATQEYFGADTSVKDGLRGICRPCKRKADNMRAAIARMPEVPPMEMEPVPEGLTQEEKRALFDSHTEAIRYGAVEKRVRVYLVHRDELWRHGNPPAPSFEAWCEEWIGEKHETCYEWVRQVDVSADARGIAEVTLETFNPKNILAQKTARILLPLPAPQRKQAYDEMESVARTGTHNQAQIEKQLKTLVLQLLPPEEPKPKQAKQSHAASTGGASKSKGGKETTSDENAAEKGTQPVLTMEQAQERARLMLAASQKELAGERQFVVVPVNHEYLDGIEKAIAENLLAYLADCDRLKKEAVSEDIVARIANLETMLQHWVGCLRQIYEHEGDQ